jgi:hypothetical protein
MPDTLQYTDSSVSKSHAHWSLFLPLIFLLLLPLVHVTLLTWQEYLRLGVVAIGLGVYARWYYQPTEVGGKISRAAMLIALGLVFVTTQFDPATSAYGELQVVEPLNATFIVSSCLGLLLFLSFWLSGNALGKIQLIDWVVVGAVFISLGLILGSHLLFERAIPINICIKLILYALIWIIATRWLSIEPAVERHFIKGLPIVFAVICLVGMVRVGNGFYHYESGRSEKENEHFDIAVLHFEKATEMGHFLDLSSLRDAAKFEKAAVLYQQGKLSEAAQTLSMSDGFVLSIAEDAWEGPSGGMLYTNISCWKDLILYNGRISITVFARGDPALGVWPKMHVRLDGDLLGEVEVDTKHVKSYAFEAQVGSGLKRLEIAFTNDYFDPPENRNLWIEQTEIRYEEISWR